jgi:exopolysaccharide biosynthesis polyprenyl glycosylphosphotransferase
VNGAVSVHEADRAASDVAMPFPVRPVAWRVPLRPSVRPVPEQPSVLDRLAGSGSRLLLVGADLLAAATGVVVGVGIVSHQVAFDSPARKIAEFGLILLALHWAAGLYRPRLSLSVLDDVPLLAGRWLAAVALAVLVQILWSKAIWQDYIIDWRFLWGALVTGAGVLVLRAGGYLLVRRLRSRPTVPRSTLILGAGSVGHDVARILVEHPEYGLHPIGFLDDDPRIPDRPSALPVLGGLAELSRLLERRHVRNVVVAFSSHKESGMVAVIRACDRRKCELFVVPRLFELQHVDDERTHAWGVPLVRLRRATYRSPAWRFKRLVDVLVSGTALLVIAPVLALIALAVRLDGGPGILFRQQRVGVDGRRFDLLKFRSLAVDDQESATTWNVAMDPRLSFVGRFLRKYSLDELPQLYNIVRGDMSLVGPRPERPHFVEQFRAVYPSYEARHRVPSGLTGWAQVHGLRGDTSIAERARFDNYYIENWSFWLDVKILLRTVTSVLRPTGS